LRILILKGADVDAVNADNKQASSLGCYGTEDAIEDALEERETNRKKAVLEEVFEAIERGGQVGLEYVWIE
jgi:hypothetical protein